MFRFQRVALLLTCLAAVGPMMPFAPATAAGGFPPISAEHQALTEVAGEPAAPAVILYRNGFMEIKSPLEEASSSRLEVELRLKILTEEGVESYGTFELPHSRNWRLKQVEGRTVKAGGAEVPLAKDAVFRETSSRSRREYVTKVAFPAVEVGAILDLRYVFMWDSIFFLEPWYFHQDIPTLHSEITYDKPAALGMTTWQKQTDSTPIEGESDRSRRGARLRVWADGLRGLPEEPFAFPENDLASRFMLIPREAMLNGMRYPILESWESVCDNFYDSYRKVTRKSGQAKRQAKTLTAGLGGARQKIDALTVFVRDEVLTEPGSNVFVSEESSVDQVLEERRGERIEKALLLQAMLEAAGFEPRLVWAPHRGDGLVDPQVPNPNWFERALVRVELDGAPLYLDPGDRSLAPGTLSPWFEGTVAVVVHPKKTEVVQLPETPFDQSTRSAEVRLAVGEDGRVSGEGSLILEGHHAWSRLHWRDDAEATGKAWTEWLEEQYPGFDVTEVEVEEAVDERRVRVGWSLAQREEDVLGDEVTLDPSRPLGPVTQAFTLPPQSRVSPVQLSYADRDVVILTVTWPEGWEASLTPPAVDVSNPAGAVWTAVEPDPAGRALTYRRRFDLVSRELFGREAYAQIRDLYAAAEKQDAQKLVLLVR